MDRRLGDTCPVVVYSRGALLEMRHTVTQGLMKEGGIDLAPGLLDQIPRELKRSCRRKKWGRTGGCGAEAPASKVYKATASIYNPQDFEVNKEQSG